MKTNIKVIEKVGKNPGKTTVILAGIHGNEVCGVKAFDEIIPKLEIVSGKVYFIYANLEAIKQNKRFIEKNLNRCFFEEQLEDIKNTLEGSTAREIIHYLESADFLLDIHSSNNPKTIPFVICDEKLIPYSNIFDANIVTYNWDPFEPGSTDNYMNKRNKPAFCIECGYLTDKNAIEIAKKSIMNFLVYTKNIYGELFTKDFQKILKIKRIYKNKGPFKKSREFNDFEKVNEKTIIGYENETPILIDKDDIVLFVKNFEKINEECFLIAKETLINKQNIIKEKENN